MHRGVDRQIADIVAVEPERELLLKRQGVKLARRGKRPLDRVVGDPVVQGIEEPDIFASMGDFDREAFESARHSGEVGSIIDDRDHLRGRGRIANRKLLE